MLNRTISKLFLPLAAGLLFAPLGWSKPLHSDLGRTVRTVNFNKATRVNGTTIQPAEYRLFMRGKELKVETLNDHTVAKSPITWEHSHKRYSATKMDIDNGALTKVDIGGTHRAVLLHNS